MSTLTYIFSVLHQIWCAWRSPHRRSAPRSVSPITRGREAHTHEQGQRGREREGERTDVLFPSSACHTTTGQMDNTGGGEPDTSDTIDVLKCLRCGHEGCTNVPGFGYPGDGPTLCSEHATPVMVQVVSLRCDHPGCNARRTFGFDGAAARLCAAHKEDGMVDLMKRRSQVRACLSSVVFL